MQRDATATAYCNVVWPNTPAAWCWRQFAPRLDEYLVQGVLCSVAGDNISAGVERPRSYAKPLVLLYYLAAARGRANYSDELPYISLSVCPLAYLENHSAKLH